MKDKFKEVDKRVSNQIMKEFSGKIINTECPSCKGKKYLLNKKCTNCEGKGSYDVQY